MARTSKSRGKKSFMLRSNNNTAFKTMGSSPMRTDPKDVKPEDITWQKEQLTSEDVVPNIEGGETTTRGYTQLGTSERPSRGKAKGVKACDPAHPNYPESCEEYKKTLALEHKRERSETTSTPKEETTQEKMAKGKHHSKYWDPKTKSYRVKQYDFKQLSSGKYTSSGKGKQTGDLSLDEWRKQYGSVEEQKKTGEVGKRTTI